MPGALETVTQAFEAFCTRFKDVDPVFTDARTRQAGQVLQARAEWVADQLDAARAEYGTVIHGDYKNANIFFQRGFCPSLSDDGAGPDTDIQMSLIDFQWSGPGLGAQDVIYLLVTSAPLACLEQEGSLIEFYLGTLNQHLASRGRDPMPRDVFQRQ